MALIKSSFSKDKVAAKDAFLQPESQFELPDPREFDLFIVKDIPTNYVLDQDDSNKYLVFDVAGNGILRIPDNMYRGTGLIVANLGIGSIEIVMDGLETFRGSKILKDPTSFMTIVKIGETIWQGSER